MQSANTIYWSKCDKDVRYHYDPVNHLKQFPTAILALGLWLPIRVSANILPTRLRDKSDGPLWRTDK